MSFMENSSGRGGRKGSEKGMGKRSNERSPKADFAVALEVEGEDEPCVKVISARENISEGSEGIILEAMLDGYAEYYSAELSEKVIQGLTDNAMKCKYNGGTCLLYTSCPLSAGQRPNAGGAFSRPCEQPPTRYFLSLPARLRRCV